MAAQVYLISKANADDPSNNYIDDVHACLINSDDAAADSVKIAEAVAQANVAGIPLKTGYFDTVELIGPPTAGIMSTDEDCIVFLRRGTARDITYGVSNGNQNRQRSKDGCTILCGI